MFLYQFNVCDVVRFFFSVHEFRDSRKICRHIRNKLSNYVLPPYCSALFVKHMPTTGTPTTGTPTTGTPTTGTPTTGTPTTNKTYYFQVDLEFDISNSSPKVLVKSANFIN